MTSRETVPIESSILVLRGQRVILAADLARIYGVETRALNQAVKRNRERFPEDFTFRLTREEAMALAQSRSQPVILKRGGNIKYLPYVFTEHGAMMAADVKKYFSVRDLICHTRVVIQALSRDERPMWNRGFEFRLTGHRPKTVET